MSLYRNELKKRRQYLSRLARITKKKLVGAPSGTLRISCNKGRIQYYHRQMPSDERGKYISKTNRILIRRLAQKNYEEELLETLEREIHAIDAYLKLCPDYEPAEVYERLNEKRRMIVSPAIETDEMYLKRWMDVEYTGNAFLKDDPEFYTDRGERVRSKSEVIIANLMAKKNIAYHYEQPLSLEGFGIVYPDFTVLNLRLRKVYYWEHLGMMDSMEYAEKAVRKLNSYQSSGIYPGEQLILTSETKGNPLNTRQIQELIMHFFI